MIRLFEQHDVRNQKELEGYWEFMPVESKQDIPSKYEYKMMVPSCWENDIKFVEYRGYAAYKKLIILEKDGNIRLSFKGVSHTADVYLDGQHIAHHYNAYTAFDVTVANVKAGKHEIVVMVDNTFSEESVLHKENDYYTYGGLIRPAVLEIVPDVFIQNIHFTPEFDGVKWTGEIKLKIKNISAEKQNVKVSLFLNDELLALFEQDEYTTIEANSESCMTKTLVFKDVIPWSCENPALYLLRAVLYSDQCQNPIDDLCERIGFRTISIENQKILLNGEAIFIQGFNRHEDYANNGCSIPLGLADSDISLMEDMGGNAVRTCHYPNDERFLDMCDERGIVIWEEHHARGFTLEQMQNPNFDKQCEDCIYEMIEEHYNHPSIIMWAILNECPSDTLEGREKYVKQFNQIKSLDQSRPLTSASNRRFKDLCFDLVDIVSLNIYFGWYFEHEAAKEIEEAYIKVLEWVNTTEGKGKPIILSEFGAGAIPGCHHHLRGKWTEERQSDILDNQLSVYLNREEIVGTFIWQFCDCRVTPSGDWHLTRPRGMNNKGIVDEYRRPKLAYNTVKKHYKSKN